MIPCRACELLQIIEPDSNYKASLFRVSALEALTSLHDIRGSKQGSVSRTNKSTRVHSRWTSGDRCLAYCYCCFEPKWHGCNWRVSPNKVRQRDLTSNVKRYRRQFMKLAKKAMGSALRRTCSKRSSKWRGSWSRRIGAGPFVFLFFSIFKNCEMLDCCWLWRGPAFK